MGLMFDDENELRCPNCGSYYFYEKEEYMVDKTEENNENIYKETSKRYALRCSKCNELIEADSSPILKIKS